MKKPDREEDKYWLPMVTDKVKGTKSIPFDHLTYERDLEKYIDYLESKVNNGVLDDVINDFYCLEHDEETEKCKVQCPYCERI